MAANIAIRASGVRRALRNCKGFAASLLYATGPFIRSVGITSIRRRGVRIAVQSSAIKDETVARLFWGHYESPERRVISKWLRDDLPVIELGASLGFVTAMVARQAPGRRQIAIEANPELIPLLSENLRANSISHVQVVPAAIDYSGSPTIGVDIGSHDSLAGHLAAADIAGSEHRDSLSVVEVPVITLREIVVQAGLDAFALICDIEGAELGLIESESLQVIKRCRQWFIELHECRAGARVIKPAQLARRIRERWGMREIERDWNVWAFERP